MQPSASDRVRTPTLVRLLRPMQWVKNGFVVAPLIFSRTFLHPDEVIRAVLAALIFCIASSAGYVINDIVDREQDRAHPTKRFRRPIASGEISVRAAAIIAALLVPLALIAAFALSLKFAGAVALYLALTTAYSIRLKNAPIIDLFTIAIGFVLRVWGGAIAVGVVLSVWMFITTLSLALYLAATKRRHELAHVTGVDARAVLQHYTIGLLDYYSETAVVSTFVFYGLYIATVRPQLALTVPIVLFGVFRYRYLVELSADESPTDRLLRDPQIIIAALVWAIVSVLVVYWTR